MKYFPPVFCWADYSTHFGGSRFAWISKMAGWSPDIQVFKSEVSGLLQLVSYVKFKVKAGSGGVVLGPMKYFPPVFCWADYSTHFGGSRFAWISKMAGWSPDIQVFKSEVSGLLQLVSYVKFKVKAGSGGVVLGPMKYFPPVFCRADYTTHFGGSRFAWISKMAGWSPDIQVFKSEVSGLLQLVSYVKFKVKAGSGGVVLGPMKYFPPVFCRADYSTHFGGSRFAWISKMAGWSPDIQVFKSEVSGLLQLVSYVKFKVKAGSGGVVLGPMKYFPPVFCRADYSTHFGGSRFAWISKMAGWSPDIQVFKSEVSGLLQLVSYVKFKVKAGSGGVVLGPMKYFPPVFCWADYSTHFGGSRFAWISKMAGWSPDI